MSELVNRGITEREIEGSIRRSVRQMTPDLLDSLMVELDFVSENAAETRTFSDGENLSHDEGLAGGEGSAARQTLAGASATQEASQSDAAGAGCKTATLPRRPRRWYRLALSAAAILVLVAVGFFAFAGQNRQVFAVVGLDVNPSVELSIDDRERVIAAEALNDDAIVVLEGLNLEGVDLNTACHAVVGSMLVKGYLRADSNSILVSTRAIDPVVGKQLEQQISQNLNSYLENSEVAVAILGQYVADDEEVSRIANEQGISLGKAWLMRKILAADSKTDEASLLELSTQDLILLAQEKNVESDTSIGASDKTAYISKDEAVEAALKDACVQKPDASQIRVEFDCEDGELVYEVEFNTAANSYEYDINARSGQVVSAEASAIEAAVSTQDDGGGRTAGRIDSDDDADDREDRDLDDERDDADDRYENDADDDRYDVDDDGNDCDDGDDDDDRDDDDRDDD